MISSFDHECVICHFAVSKGDEVTAGARDLLVPASAVWMHSACAVMHRNIAQSAPVYGTGWFCISMDQRCARCRNPMLAGDIAWRVISVKHQIYQTCCGECHAAASSSAGTDNGTEHEGEPGNART